jgi:hypothetical protein
MTPTDVHHRYWTDEDKRSSANIKTFSALAEMALQIMKRMPPRVHAVSGPITTGGLGNAKDNMALFKKTTEDLAIEKGLNVLSWVPFEDIIVSILKEWKKANPDEKYCMPLLDDFYLPLFESGLISDIHFIYGWDSSMGARWEHDQCVRLNIARHFLPKS